MKFVELGIHHRPKVDRLGPFRKLAKFTRATPVMLVFLSVFLSDQQLGCRDKNAQRNGWQEDGSSFSAEDLHSFLRSSTPDRSINVQPARTSNPLTARF
jgi:hypothetical protein